MVKTTAARYKMTIPCLTLSLEVRREAEGDSRHYQVMVPGSGDILSNN